MLLQDVEAYIKGCDVCLASKTVCYKLYKDLFLLSILNHHLNDLSINFIIAFLILADWKDDSYNPIFVIVD